MIYLDSSSCDYITTDDVAYGIDKIPAELEEHVAINNVSVNYILLHNLSSQLLLLILLQTIELLREEDFTSQSSGWDDQLDRYRSILLMTLLVLDFS